MWRLDEPEASLAPQKVSRTPLFCLQARLEALNPLVGVTLIDCSRIIIYYGNSIEKVKVETYPKSVSESQIDI